MLNNLYIPNHEEGRRGRDRMVIRFIVESGVKHHKPKPNHDINNYFCHLDTLSIVLTYILFFLLQEWHMASSVTCHQCTACTLHFSQFFYIFSSVRQNMSLSVSV